MDTTHESKITIIRPKTIFLYNTITYWCATTVFVLTALINCIKNGITWYTLAYLILALFWVVLSVILTRKTSRIMRGVILLTDDCILMSECAARVEGKRLSSPTTLDVAWSQVESVTDCTIVLRSGEVYSYPTLSLSKKFWNRANTSPFDIYDWEKIKNGFFKYKNKTQQ